MTSNSLAITNCSIAPVKAFVEESKICNSITSPQFVYDALDLVGSVWKYLGKLIQMTKQGLNIFLKGHPNGSSFSESIKRTIRQLRVTSFVSIGLNFMPLIASVKESIKCLYERDYVSSAFSLTSTSMIALDTIDTFATFLEGWYGKLPPAFQILGIVEKPIIFYLTIVGSFSRLCKIRSTFGLYGKAKTLEHMAQTNPEKFDKSAQTFLNEITHITNSEQAKLDRKFINDPSIQKDRERIKIIEKKKRACNRKVGSEIYGQLCLLRDSNQDRQVAVQVIKNIQGTILAKSICNIIGIAANILTIIGVLLFSCSVAAFVPHVFIFLAFAVRLVEVLLENPLKKSYIEEVAFKSSSSV